MTNHTLALGDRIDDSVRSLAHAGGKRRPVKVVEHPVFRASRRHLAFEVPFTVVRVPLVVLNGPAPATPCGCPGSTTTHEAA